jgi:phage repressor protein C with HTH and peptisase S24 domain
MSQTLTSRLERAMRDAGYNPRSLSLAAGLGMTAVRDILDGRIASPRYQTVEALARLLGVSVAWLMNGEAAAEAQPSAAPPAPAAVQRDFPVYGAAQGGPSGAMAMSSDPIQHIACPDPLMTVKAGSGYGIYVVGESMSPAYEQGDIALVHRGLPPRRHSDVILVRREADGTPHALIKHLVGWTDAAWRVRQYNPPAEYELPRGEWTEIETIVGRYNAR